MRQFDVVLDRQNKTLELICFVVLFELEISSIETSNQRISSLISTDMLESVMAHTTPGRS